MPAMLSVSRGIHVPFDEFVFTFARSGGPGGQNVNKVNSKAILRWPVTTSPSLPESVRSRFLAKYASRLTFAGELVLTSQKYRDQDSNKGECLEKLKEMLLSIAVPPTPRRPTKPTRRAEERRVEIKKEISQKKQQRRLPALDD